MIPYAPSLVMAWDIAAGEAIASNSSEIEPAHLLIGLCKVADLDRRQFAAPPGTPPMVIFDVENDIQHIQQMFQRAGLDPTSLRRQLRALITQPGMVTHMPVGQTMHRSKASRLVFTRAEEIARREQVHNPALRPQHLLRSVFETEDIPWQELLGDARRDDLLGLMNEVAAKATELVAAPSMMGMAIGEQQAGAVEHGGRRTPYLDHFGRDLTQQARDGKLDPVIGRQEEIRNLARVLTQKRKNNAILVGEAGVGKTCIIEGLAQWLIGPNVPPELKDRRIISIAMAELLAGAKYRGEFEQRLEMIIEEARVDDNVILFIDEIHTVLDAGGEGASSAANILKPALARGDLSCLGATTTAEYRRYIEQDPALERRFHVVWVEEPSRDETIAILQGLCPRFEEHHNLEITEDAIIAAVDLSIRYLTDSFLPDKAIDLIDQACARVRIGSLSGLEGAGPSNQIDRNDIVTLVARRSRIPIERLTTDEMQHLLNMEANLRERVMGQDEAIKAVSEVIRMAKIGLKDTRRPMGIFLFVGATGTGKTELAKALAEFLFGDERQILRFDMSEYMEKHSVARLIGAPPGYVGYEEEGQLTGPVRTRPYSVLLFDEIEKAHPEVLDIFLQMFDEGHLTDARGQRVSFTETVIIMTSNLGSSIANRQRSLGFQAREDLVESQQAAYRQQIMQAVNSALRLELLNRIQNVVLFYPLTEPVVRQIIDKILHHVRARLEQWQMTLELSDDAYALLMENGYDPDFGAREMERAVERLVVQPLGKVLLEKRFKEGASVYVDVHEGSITLQDRGATNFLLDMKR